MYGHVPGRHGLRAAQLTGSMIRAALNKGRSFTPPKVRTAPAEKSLHTPERRDASFTPVDLAWA
jgi:hypothetical protein